MFWILYFFFFTLVISSNALTPQPGKLHYEFGKDENEISVPRALYKDSEIFAQVRCETEKSIKITVQLNFTELSCWTEFIDFRINRASNNTDPLRSIQKSCICPCHVVLEPELVTTSTDVIQVEKGNLNMPMKNIILADFTNKNDNKSYENSKNSNQLSAQSVRKGGNKHGVFTISSDGVYFLTAKIRFDKDDETMYNRNVSIDIEMKGPNGYLSAIDSPLLMFYGTMCLVYIILGITWLIVSFLQWRDLLRIQFWIGAVILLGMLEKAMFFAEYDTINNKGENIVPGTVLFAEYVSCAKRTLARMLVIIVSFGFGIVKPRLGSHLHRVVCFGVLYFSAAVWEAYSRVVDTISNQLANVLIATVCLAVLDSFICWWIFSNLVQTTRTLRLRRNLVKLALYNHFTNTLICAVIVSVVFMIYSIKTRKISECIMEWKDIWIDDAFWHLLFSIILLVIMILWRPTNNNQRYAFSPLLDAIDDDDEDDEDIEHFVNDAYGVKMRGYNNYRNESPKHKNNVNSADDDLKWVEENIPPSLISMTLPILDSDEDIMSTKFEISKME